jgi:hypothetical protein
MYKQKITQSDPTFCQITNRIEWNRETPEQCKVIYKVHFQSILIKSNRKKFQAIGLKYPSSVKGRIRTDKIKNKIFKKEVEVPQPSIGRHQQRKGMETNQKRITACGIRNGRHLMQYKTHMNEVITGNIVITSNFVQV